MTVTVDQSKLVLNAFAAIFENNLVSSQLADWHAFDTELNDRNGLNVSEQIEPRYVVEQTVNGVKDLSSGVQDSVFGSEQFSLNRTFNTSMGWSDFDKIKNIGDARESRALKAAAMNLAEGIDNYVMGFIADQSNNWTQAAGGVTVADYTDVATAYTRLKEEGCDDADLRMVLSYADRQALGETVIAYNSTDALATNAFRKGFAGEVDNIPTMFTQQLGTITVGSRTASGSVTMDGANQHVDYKDVAVSSSPGFYLTQEIDIVLASGDTIVAGEVFSMTDVKAYDNRAQKALSHDQQFVVVTGDTGDASNNGTIRIFPALIVPNTGSGADVDVNTAHATVSITPTTNNAMTFLGTASTTYTPRFMIQKGAIVINTAPLVAPDTGKMLRQTLSEVPLTVRMWKDSDFSTGNHRVRFDVAATANVRERRRIIRMNGIA